MDNSIENLEKQEKNKPERDERGRLLPGNTANPNGRPKGKTLKEWAREKLMNMTDEEKEEFIKQLPKDIVWKMAEGMPSQDTTLKGDENNPIKHEFVWKSEQSKSITPQETGQENSTTPPNDTM